MMWGFEQVSERVGRDMRRWLGIVLMVTLLAGGLPAAAFGQDDPTGPVADNLWNATNQQMNAKNGEEKKKADEAYNKAKEEFDKLTESQQKEVVKKLGDKSKKNLNDLVRLLRWLAKLDKKNPLRALYGLVFDALEKLISVFTTPTPAGAGCLDFYTNVGLKLGMTAKQATEFAIAICEGTPGPGGIGAGDKGGDHEGGGGGGGGHN